MTERKQQPYDVVATQFFKRLIRTAAVPSCINCGDWDTKQEKCKLYGSRPPAEVIVSSCEINWYPDIPF